MDIKNEQIKRPAPSLSQSAGESFPMSHALYGSLELLFTTSMFDSLLCLKAVSV